MFKEVKLSSWDMGTAEVHAKVPPHQGNPREQWDGVGVVMQTKIGTKIKYEGRSYLQNNRKSFDALDDAVNHVCSGYAENLQFIEE